MPERKTLVLGTALFLTFLAVSGCALPRGGEGRTGAPRDPPPSVVSFSLKTRVYREGEQIVLSGQLRGPAPLPDRLDVWIRADGREEVEDVEVRVRRRVSDDEVEEGLFTARLPGLGSQRMTIRIVPHGDPKPLE